MTLMETDTTMTVRVADARPTSRTTALVAAGPTIRNKAGGNHSHAAVSSQLRKRPTFVERLRTPRSD